VTVRRFSRPSGEAAPFIAGGFHRLTPAKNLKIIPGAWFPIPTGAFWLFFVNQAIWQEPST
jgi:hypothetical protein